MSYDTAIEELLSLGHELAPGSGTRRKFDLRNMRALMQAMGHPERSYPSVLIAGTNGKGSTAATLASILRASGYRTGLYTSPHLIRPNERIQIDKAPIADSEFAAVHDRVKQIGERLAGRGHIPATPSFFETLTAMAFEHFRHSEVDIAVLEVGLGGRLDATNVVDPIVSAITDIALDHQEWLGETIAEIAREKAGILRPHGLLVTLPQHPEANRVLGDTATELQVEAINAARHVPAVSPGAEKAPSVAPSGLGFRDPGFRTGGFRSRYPLEVLGEQILVDSPLAGRHQLRNLAIAIAVAEQLKLRGYKISAEAVANGIRTTAWPGRLQLVPGAAARPDVVLDVAHNPAGAWALRSAISEALDADVEPRPTALVFGAMSDKPILEMAEILFPVAKAVIATRAESPRSARPEEILTLAGHLAERSAAASAVPEALDRAFGMVPENGLVIVTGSVYVVGAALAELEKRGVPVKPDLQNRR